MGTTDLINVFSEEKVCFYKEEKYSVRDNGAVFRHTPKKKKKRKLDGLWTFGKKDERTGYMKIGDHRIHIIVARTFLGVNDSTKYVVDHIDTNRCNNRIENLRWLTKLENALNNPATRKKIEFLCGGNIQKFIDNPSCLRDITGNNQDVMWMRTVSKEEAQSAYARIMEWAKTPSPQKKNNSKIGEWIYSPFTPQEEKSNITPSLSPNALQKNWTTPTEFPLCPLEITNSALQTYFTNLKKGMVVSKNKYNTHFIAEFALHETTLIIRTYTDGDEDIKSHALMTVTFDGKNFIHEGRTFMEEFGAQKQFTLVLGLPWTKGDGIDDYI